MVWFLGYARIYEGLFILSARFGRCARRSLPLPPYLMQERLDCGSVSGAGTNYQTVSVGGDNLCRMQAAGQSAIETRHE